MLELSLSLSLSLSLLCFSHLSNSLLIDFYFRKKPKRYDTFTQVRGTYAYMSPEIRFRQPVTVKSDVYAVGIILWEMTYRAINGVYQVQWWGGRLAGRGCELM